MSNYIKIFGYGFKILPNNGMITRCNYITKDSDMPSDFKKNDSIVIYYNDNEIRQYFRTKLVIEGFLNKSLRNNEYYLKAIKVSVCEVSDYEAFVEALRTSKCINVNKNTLKTVMDLYKQYHDFGTSISRFGEKTLRKTNISYNTNSNVVSVCNNLNKEFKLYELLKPYNVSKKQIDNLMKKDENILEMIYENPYCLTKLLNINFIKCDAIGRQLKINPQNINRIKGAITYMLFDNECKGNLYANIEELYKNVEKLLNQLINYGDKPLTIELYKEALKVAFNRHEIVIRNQKCIFLLKADNAERTTCMRLLEIMHSNPINLSMYDMLVQATLNSVVNTLQFRPSDNQIAAAKKSLINRVSIITGGPGTGKSTIIKMIIDVYNKVFHDQITLLAPTGKAARRMYQTTGIAAQTIHKRLNISCVDESNEFNPNHEVIDSGLVVIDESSMIDQYLMEKILDSINPTKCHLIFLGDIYQLPSVGAGSVLQQMIDSNVIPTSMLTETFRQKGSDTTIIDNALRINRGELTLVCNDTFQLYIPENGKKAQDMVKTLFIREMNVFGIDNITLLCPRRQAGDNFYCSSDALNTELQNVINPSSKNKPELNIKGTVFREGDKVLQWKNKKDSSNGDIGTINRIVIGEFNKIYITWDNGNNVIYQDKDMEDLSLAYAISIHKSQGSEYDSCIIPLIDEESCELFKRNLFYTAVTRAKKRVIVVGNIKSIEKCIREADTNKRNTMLAKRIIFNGEKYIK